MASNRWRWRRYIEVSLNQLGYDRPRDNRSIIASIMRLLRGRQFDFTLAEQKLSVHKFKKSKEQQQTTEAIRDVLLLGPGEGKYRPQPRMVKITERDEAIQVMHADPALAYNLEEQIAGVMAKVKNLRETDQKILLMRACEGKTIQEIANAIGMSGAHVSMRFRGLLIMLAMQITPNTKQ